MGRVVTRNLRYTYDQNLNQVFMQLRWCHGSKRQSGISISSQRSDDQLSLGKS